MSPNPPKTQMQHYSDNPEKRYLGHFLCPLVRLFILHMPLFSLSPFQTILLYSCVPFSLSVHLVFPPQTHSFLTHFFLQPFSFSFPLTHAPFLLWHTKWETPRFNLTVQIHWYKAVVNALINHAGSFLTARNGWNKPSISGDINESL